MNAFVLEMKAAHAVRNRADVFMILFNVWPCISNNLFFSLPVGIDDMMLNADGRWRCDTARE